MPHRREASWARACLALLALAAAACAGGAHPDTDEREAGRPGYAAAARPPLRFEPGPAALGDTRWVARAPRHTVALSGDGILLAGAHSRIRMRIEGADRGAKAQGRRPLPGRSHYLLGGDPQGWRRDVAGFSRVHFAQVRPGIDVDWYATRAGELEFDFVAAPGSRPELLELRFEGTDEIRVEPDGSLALVASGDHFLLRAPVVYQEGSPAREIVDARYALVGEAAVGFVLGPWDRDRTLVIDPIVSFATYLGGSDADASRAVTVDRDGFIYVVGDAVSIDFPLQDPLQPSYGGGVHDAFVAKLSREGSELVWATYLGGTLHDRAFAVDVDDYGNVFVTGRTGSADFPLASASQSVYAGGTNDAFVAKIDPSGARLLYSTFLGGGDDDRGLAIAVDRYGETTVAGLTLSTDFPLASPLQTTLQGGADAFVSRLDAEGQTLVYSTYLGGSGTDNARGAVVDDQGRTWIAGDTNSSDFPVSPTAVQPVIAGGYDAWLGRLDAAGQTLAPATFLGGGQDDFGLAVAGGPQGTVALTGITESTAFPVLAPFQPALGGQLDAFVARFDASGTSLLHSSYLGGSLNDFALATAFDSLGRIVVAGNSNSVDFPVSNAVQPLLAGGFDDVLARIDTDGSLLDATFLGGSGDDLGFDRLGVAVTPDDGVVFAGRTRSTDYPVEAALQPTFGGGLSDATLVRIGVGPEVRIVLQDVGGRVELTLRIANGTAATIPLDLWLWRELPGSSAPVPIAANVPLSLPMVPNTDVVTLDLGGTLDFPGTRVGARLRERRTGALLSESLCEAVPCNL